MVMNGKQKCNSPELKHKKKLFEVGGKHETWHKDAFRDGGVKLIRSYAKICVKTISGRIFCFRPL